MQEAWSAPFKGQCCEYDVLVAHCVGFCEKVHFVAESATLPNDLQH